MIPITGLTKEEREMLVSLLEAGDPSVTTTIKDIRVIDKICSLLENPEIEELSLEDADYEYMKNRLCKFSAWIPRGRKEIIALADKLRI